MDIPASCRRTALSRKGRKRKERSFAKPGPDKDGSSRKTGPMLAREQARHRPKVHPPGVERHQKRFVALNPMMRGSSVKPLALSREWSLLVKERRRVGEGKSVQVGGEHEGGSYIK